MTKAMDTTDRPSEASQTGSTYSGEQNVISIHQFAPDSGSIYGRSISRSRYTGPLPEAHDARITVLDVPLENSTKRGVPLSMAKVKAEGITLAQLDGTHVSNVNRPLHKARLFFKV
jgi:hypothetical protein